MSSESNYPSTSFVEYKPSMSLFGISKKDKSKMIGSPTKKRNFNISPQKNKEVKKFKKSRERDRRSPTFKNTPH